MEERKTFDQLRRSIPVIILSLGAIGLTACDNQGDSSEQNFEENVSDFIGKMTGVYDEDGNTIPREKTPPNTTSLEEDDSQ